MGKIDYERNPNSPVDHLRFAVPIKEISTRSPDDEGVTTDIINGIQSRAEEDLFGNRYVIGRYRTFTAHPIGFVRKVQPTPWGQLTVEIQQPNIDANSFTSIFRFNEPDLDGKMLRRLSIVRFTPILPSENQQPSIKLQVGNNEWAGRIAVARSTRIDFSDNKNVGLPMLVSTEDQITHIPDAPYMMTLEMLDDSPGLVLEDMDRCQFFGLPIYQAFPHQQSATLANHYLGDERPFDFSPSKAYRSITKKWLTHI